MIRLAIICFLISIIESKRCSFNITEFHEIKSSYFKAENVVNEATKDQNENAVIVLGDERSGKSALINYLMGNELKTCISRKAFDRRIKVANNNTKGPEIIYGELSKSEIPTKWSSIRPELQNLDIWHTAGFERNENEKQELINNFYLYHLSKKVENLKFIVIISFSDIHDDNDVLFLKFLRKLEKYFNSTFKNVFTSISVIISNAPHLDDNDNQVNNEYVNKKFQQLLNTVHFISKDSKDFLQHLKNNNQRVAFFRKPKSNGKLTSDDIDYNIIPAINNCESISKPSHQDIGLPISEETESCVRHSMNESDSSLQTSYSRLSSPNWTYSEFNKTKSYPRDSRKYVVLRLRRIYMAVLNHKNDSDMLVKMRYLQFCASHCIDLKNETNLVEKADLIGFFDQFIKSGLAESTNKRITTVIANVYILLYNLILTCFRNLNF